MQGHSEFELVQALSFIGVVENELILYSLVAKGLLFVDFLDKTGELRLVDQAIAVCVGDGEPLLCVFIRLVLADVFIVLQAFLDLLEELSFLLA